MTTPDLTPLTPAAPELNRAKLCVLRILLNSSWEVALTEYLVGRCGCTQADWDGLLAAGWVKVGTRGQQGRWIITDAGRAAYRSRPKHLYF